MTLLRTGLMLLLGLAVGALFGNACVVGSGDCDCPMPRPLARGTFRVTQATSSSTQGDSIAPLQTATLIIAEDAVVIEYVHDGAPIRATYSVANKYDLTP